MDAITHAAALLEVIREADYPSGYMLNFAELCKVYRELCQQNNWRQRSWHSVGREFDRLTTGGAKPYAYFTDENGRSQRLRIYPVPEEPATASLRVA